MIHGNGNGGYKSGENERRVSNSHLELDLGMGTTHETREEEEEIMQLCCFALCLRVMCCVVLYFVVLSRVLYVTQRAVVGHTPFPHGVNAMFFSNFEFEIINKQIIKCTFLLSNLFSWDSLLKCLLFLSFF